MKNYWLAKSEPTVYSIDDMKKDKVTGWNGVRNFKARSYLKEMKIGDQVLFYHSNSDPKGVAGIVKVCSEPKADPTQFDKKSDYYEPKATKEKPYWYMVDVKFKKKLPRVVTLEEIKNSKKLEGIGVAKRGNRLSVQRVSKEHFDIIVNEM